MNTIKRAVKRILRSPANALAASSTRLISLIGGMIDGSLSCDIRVQKYCPYAAGRDAYAMPKPGGDGTQGRDDAGLPIPPKELWLGYGDTPEWYLQSGRKNDRTMREIANTGGFRLEDARRILDFGCGAGRMIRCLNDLAGHAEIWGVDVSASHIFWCRENLSPPFDFATVTLLPHLPFEDDSFDFIYAGSVFTHIDDLAEAWLLELRRIVCPGGRLYITVHDRHTIEMLTDPEYTSRPSPEGEGDGKARLQTQVNSFIRNNNIMNYSFHVFAVDPGPRVQVFYDADYLRRHWGRFLGVASYNLEAYGYQSAVLLEKDRAS